MRKSELKNQIIEVQNYEEYILYKVQKIKAMYKV